MRITPDPGSRSRRRLGVTLVGVGAVVTALAGCVDDAFKIGDGGFVLPATLEDMLPMAQSIATEWDSDAYLWGMGGGFTITDPGGRAFSHSYRFYSQRLQNRLDLHVFGGAPWGDESFKWPPPTPVYLNPPSLTSAEAIEIVVEAAEDLQITPAPDSVLTARYLSFPVWPELGATAQPESLAWRVDFLDKRISGIPGDQDLVWWSLLRAYVHPLTGEILEFIEREEKYPAFDRPPPPGP